MKTLTYLPLLAGSALLSLGFAGCISVHNSPPPPVQTVTTTTTYGPGYAVTTLPVGYTTTVYRGRTYYTYNGTYYRTTRHGYVVVDSPLNE